MPAQSGQSHANSAERVAMSRGTSSPPSYSASTMTPDPYVTHTVAQGEKTEQIVHASPLLCSQHACIHTPSRDLSPYVPYSGNDRSASDGVTSCNHVSWPSLDTEGSPTVVLFPSTLAQPTRNSRNTMTVPRALSFLRMGTGSQSLEV